MAKYLDLTGLQKYDEKSKEYVTNNFVSKNSSDDLTFSGDLELDGNNNIYNATFHASCDFTNAQVTGLDFVSKNSSDDLTFAGDVTFEGYVYANDIEAVSINTEGLSTESLTTASLNVNGTSADFGQATVALGGTVDFAGAQVTGLGNLTITSPAFKGTCDFTNAQVTGLNTSTSSGGGKTKVTLAELRTLLANYTDNMGKLIQIFYKGSSASSATSAINKALGTVGLLSIYGDSASNTVSTTEVGQSSMYIISNYVFISSSSARLSISNYSYTYGEASIDEGTTYTYDFSDTDYDFYVL